MEEGGSFWKQLQGFCIGGAKDQLTPKSSACWRGPQGAEMVSSTQAWPGVERSCDCNVELGA